MFSKYKLKKLPSLSRRVNQCIGIMWFLAIIALVLYGLDKNASRLQECWPILVLMFLAGAIFCSGRWPECWHPRPARFEDIF